MKTTQAHRIIWPRPGQVGIEAFQYPLPQDDQVLVEALVSLISPGTERAFFLARPNTHLDFPAPAVGYSHVGRIVACGRAVEEFQIGDLVASNARHVSHTLLKTRRLVKIPAGVLPCRAVFFNLLAIALQGVRKARIELGASVAVIGQGLVGQFALQFAKLAGAFPVIGVDMVTDRLDLSRKCGADHVINPDDADLAEGISRLTGGRGVDTVIECTGRPEPIVGAFPLIAERGRLVLLGSPRGSSPEVNFYPQIHVRGISIVGAHADIRPARDRSPHHWTWKQDCALVFKLLAAGRLKVGPMISAIYPWQEAASAYAHLCQDVDANMGVLLNWARRKKQGGQEEIMHTDQSAADPPCCDPSA